jgi:hypothetical protein
MTVTAEHHYLLFAQYLGIAALHVPDSYMERECWREAKGHLRMARAREREEVGI